MLFILRTIVGMVGAFITKGLLTAGFQQVLGSRMLEQAGWTPGTTPPGSYMVASVTAALFAAFVAGIVAALIVGRARFQLALAYAVLFSGLALWANRTTLFDNPHPYEWPLILAPVLAMPLGAWLVCYWMPSRKNTSG